MGQRGDGSPTHPVIGLHSGERISKKRLGPSTPKSQSSEALGGLTTPKHWWLSCTVPLPPGIILGLREGTAVLPSSGKAVQSRQGALGDSPSGPTKIDSWLLLLSFSKFLSSLSWGWENPFPVGSPSSEALDTRAS